MSWLADVDWQRMFEPQTPLLEIVVRGTIVYLALYTLLRVVLKRQRGGVGVTDLLVLVLIADASQNAMADGYQSVTDGILLVAVIVGWAYALDWLGFHLPTVQRFVHPPPLLLFDGRRLHRRNLARENITDDELESHLRVQGVRSLDEVERILLEGDGRLSVMRKEGGGPPPQQRRLF